MTRGTGRVALLALLLGAAQQLPHRAAASSASDGTELPPRLADTGLYVAGGEGEEGGVAPRNRPFAPQYPLWSDGAAKRRWVYLPEGTAIDARNADEWNFPVGTRFWKEFSFAGRKVETRLLWKASAAGWVAGSYLWNEEGTDAVLAPENGVPGVFEIASGRQHSIPSRADCAACHGATRAPLGFNRLQLSADRDPNAIHGEPLTRDMVTLDTLAEERLLSPVDTASSGHQPRIVASQPATRAVLGYFSANCGTCHNGSQEISALVPSLKYTDVMGDGDAAARRLIGQRSKWQAPGKPDGTTMLIDPESHQSSAILLRMGSRRPSSQMPPLATVVRDQVAIDAISRWIAELAPHR
jgi:hypothetical protein